MKQCILLSFLSFFTLQLSYSQMSERYPLHVGNLWQYMRFMGQWPDLVSRQVLRDTVMPNGRTYAEIRGWDNYTSWLEYYSSSGDSVFQYDTYLLQEELWYDFSRSEGDTIAVFPRFGDTTVIVLIDTSIINWYGQPRLRWYFFIDNRVHGVDDEIVQGVIDSIGLTSESGFGFSMNLQGAIINGIQYGTIVNAKDPSSLQPTMYYLHQNYPNPFNPRTTITFELPRSEHVVLKIFNVLGQEMLILLNREFQPGKHSVELNAESLPSGVYFYRMYAGDFFDTKKFILLK